MVTKKYFMLLLLITPHALASGLIFDFIGTWKMVPTWQSDNESYVIYHSPHRYKGSISLCIGYYNCTHSEDTYYGRYDVIAEMQPNTKVRLLNGIWFHPVDPQSNEIYEIEYRDIDLENFKFPAAMETITLSKNMVKIQILSLDSENFNYQEYNPLFHIYEVFQTKRAADISIDKIKRLPYLPIPHFY